MNKSLASHEVDANPGIIRDPDARQKRRNRSGQAGGLISKSKIDKPFNWRKVEMQESPAYRVLSLSARRVMDRLEIEFARHGLNPMENGILPCTYDDFVEYGVDRNAIAPAIRELVALGFVQVTRKGSAGNEAHRQVALFLLTYRHAGSDARIEDGWKRIKTMDEAEDVAKSARAGKADARAIEFGRRGALARWAKNKTPVMETILRPVMETILKAEIPSHGNHTEGALSPVMETIPLSILSLGPPRERGRADGMMARYMGHLPWSPPRTMKGRIRPKPGVAGEPVPIDAMTVLEGLLLPNALTDGSARSDAVH
jgi:hypothetical protein